MKHLRVHGKRDKIRFVPAHPRALELITDYLEATQHGQDLSGALFRPAKNQMEGGLDKPLTSAAIYTCVVKKYAAIATGRRRWFLRSLTPLNGRDERARALSGHRKSAGVARAREHLDNQAL